MSDLLSIEERNALQEPYASGSTAPSGTPVVFPSANHLDPERTSALSSDLSRWLASVTADLSRLLRVPCVARSTQPQFIPRSALLTAEAEPFWAAVDQHPGHDLLLSLPRAFAAALCERIFGAPWRLGEKRALTPGEATLLREVIGRWSEFFAEVWPQRAIALSDANSADEEPEDAGVSTWLTFRADLICGPVETSVSVAMRPATARLLLGEGGVSEADLISSDDLLSRLGEVPVELQAVLGHAEFTLDELANLRVGDIIALDRRAQETLDIVIDGRPFLRARAGLAGQQVALEVVGDYSQEVVSP